MSNARAASTHATSTHITFLDAKTNKTCYVRIQGTRYNVETVNAIINSPLYRGAMGNMKAAGEMQKIAPNGFFLRYSAKVEDFVFCANAKAKTKGLLARQTHVRINLRDILQHASGAEFNPVYFLLRADYIKENTVLLQAHNGLVQTMLDQLPNATMLCPPRTQVQEELGNMSVKSSTTFSLLSMSAMSSSASSSASPGPVASEDNVVDISKQTPAAAAAAVSSDAPPANRFTLRPI